MMVPGTKHSVRLGGWMMAVGVGSVLAACAAISAGDDGENTDIYYSSQAEADADLARFEAENPGCPLWTNWQKTCSRISGKTHCSIDSGNDARPSRPFCTTDAGFSDVGQERSYLRFCEATDWIGITDVGTGVRVQRLICDRFASDRPFNGRSLQPLRSPACMEWSKRYSGDVICREGNDDCDGVKPEQDGFYCSKYELEGCDYLESFTGKARNETPMYKITNGIHFRDKISVHGIKCE